MFFIPDKYSKEILVRTAEKYPMLFISNNYAYKKSEMDIVYTRIFNYKIYISFSIKNKNQYPIEYIMDNKEIFYFLDDIKKIDILTHIKFLKQLKDDINIHNNFVDNENKNKYKLFKEAIFNYINELKLTDDEKLLYFINGLM